VSGLLGLFHLARSIPFRSIPFRLFQSLVAWAVSVATLLVEHGKLSKWVFARGSRTFGRVKSVLVVRRVL